MKQQILGFLGLLFVGERAFIGEIGLENIASSHLVYLAKDASDNTKKMITNKCLNYKVPCLTSLSKAELGGALGYNEVSYVVIKDKKASLKLQGLEEEKHEEI